MGSVDLKQAYYSVLIAVPHRRFLRFRWQDTLYEFTCLPNGLAACPRIFTMLLKPIYAAVSVKGFVSFPYIEDSFVIADSVIKCQNALNELCIALTTAGFYVHQQESALTLTNRLKCVGFGINRITLEITLTDDKVLTFIEFANNLLS
jgi:hypothetical protein